MHIWENRKGVELAEDTDINYDGTEQVVINKSYHETLKSRMKVDVHTYIHTHAHTHTNTDMS